MKSDPRRALTQQTYALVLAGGRGSRLRQLTDHRAKPAVPFAGTMRIIDFALGNCVNSGLRRIGVLTQYKAQSLIRHIERSWGFLEASLGEYVDIVPAQQQTRRALVQRHRRRRVPEPGHPARVAAALRDGAGRRPCLQDGLRRDAGRARGARRRHDAWPACEVPLDDACDFGVMAVDAEHRIVAFDEKPARPKPLPGQPDRALASMGIYVFNADFLVEQLERDAADPASSHDFGKDLIPRLVAARTCMRTASRTAASTWSATGPTGATWARSTPTGKPTST